MTDGRPTLGFIGTGLMGSPMAVRLLAAGYRLLVWNRTAEKAAGLVANGAIICATPAEATANADIVMLCLTDAAAVKAVALGGGGVVSTGSADKILIDFSTIPPGDTRAIAAALEAACGMTWVDAPVSGGVPGAEQGTLAIMCGGRDRDLQRVRPVLDRLARRVTHMGPLGAGQITKMCNQLIVSCNLVAIAEAVTLGRAAGIDIAELADAVAGGWADSLPLQIFAPRMAAGTEEPRMGAVATMRKDAKAIAALCQEVGLAAPMATSVAAVYDAAADAGYLDRDLTAVAEFIAGRKS